MEILYGALASQSKEIREHPTQSHLPCCKSAR